jgi:hypothetical protein
MVYTSRERMTVPFSTHFLVHQRMNANGFLLPNDFSPETGSYSKTQLLLWLLKTR